MSLFKSPGESYGERVIFRVKAMGETVKYVCKNCGNVYESRAKVPQCPLCKSKRKMKFEDFLKLSKEEQERILGKPISGDSSESSGETKEIQGEKPGETTGETVKVEGEKVESQSEPVKIEEDSLSETVKNRVKEREKKGEKAKGEKVKSDSGKIPIPKPRISLKGVAIISVVFVYFLYKMGFFDSMIEHLKRLKAFKDVEEENEEVEEVSFENPVLERAKKNLAG